MNPLTSFFNGSYLQGFFKDYQFDKSETGFIAHILPSFLERVPVRAVHGCPMLAASLYELHWAQVPTEWFGCMRGN